MARVVVIKDLSKFEPSITNIILSSMMNSVANIERYQSGKTYNTGDKVYIIQEGQLIIKECISDNVTIMNDTYWIKVESALGSGSTTQNPNATQNISYFETKIVNEITNISQKLNTIIGLDDSDLKNTHVVPLYSEDEITLTSGKFEFGRVFI